MWLASGGLPAALVHEEGVLLVPVGVKNREQAWRVLAARIKAKRDSEQQAKEASERKSLIGSGERSDRMGTYNFPQNRVTDHRINLTSYQLDSVLNGDLDEFIDELTTRDQAEKLQAAGL